ncbi:hypothetical protein [Thalassospira sp.]|uniref:hypothetical protein n=1 Tax=Thalassospira sp. TaxID=1912094 RepID=UPI0032EDE8A9
MRTLPQCEFDVYALSFPWGHGFSSTPPIGALISDDGLALGIIIHDEATSKFGYIAMCRREDAVWTIVKETHGLPTRSSAEEKLAPFLESVLPVAPVPSGDIVRPALFDFGDRKPNDVFRLLVEPSHQPALWAIKELYLALPKPDRNWASDFQTTNFHTRLWEAQLLASLREQGLLVTQPHESPDFRVQNRLGQEVWIEAVTANPSAQYNHLFAKPSAPPDNRPEVFFGRGALRFAKTIGNKRAKKYEKLPHVSGKPFALAIADFQEPGSMLWSRESLIGYLYGTGAEVTKQDGQTVGRSISANTLLGPSGFPAGLFANDEAAELSAVIFTNACTISKLYRVPISGMGSPIGFRYTRMGNFFDRTPSALEGIPFCMDITSEEYRSLWEHGYEPWCAEMEVFHNPFAKHPMPFALMPEVTHWFVGENGIECLSTKQTSILWSQTLVTKDTDPPITLDDFLGR